MIIGKDFIFGHIMKTGGTTIHHVFHDLFEKEIIFADSDKLHFKHETFVEKIKKERKHFKGQKRVLGFRKLPEWILSVLHHFERTDNQKFDLKNYKDGKLFIPYGGKLAWYSIDELLKSYINIDLSFYEFIRTEYLAEDFIKVFSKYFNISKTKQKKIEKYHAAKNTYKKDIFTEQQKIQFYKDCPYWTKLELMLYANED